MIEREPIKLTINVDTSRFTDAMRRLQRATWRIFVQRRTLRWRRLPDGTVEIVTPRQPTRKAPR